MGKVLLLSVNQFQVLTGGCLLISVCQGMPARSLGVQAAFVMLEVRFTLHKSFALFAALDPLLHDSLMTWNIHVK